METTSCSDQSSAGSDERSLNRDYKHEKLNVETTSCSDRSSAGSDERSLNRDYKHENRNKASFLYTSIPNVEELNYINSIQYFIQ